MGKPVVGQVVSSNFPFSDLTSTKRRPVLVVALAEFDDLILCQITSRAYSSATAITLKSTDFESGALPLDSYIRPDKLFTASATIIDKTHGVLTGKKLSQAKATIRQLFT